MSVIDHNLDRLAIFFDPKTAAERNQVIKWHDVRFLPETAMSNAQLLLLPEQSGGKPKFYITEINGQTYALKFDIANTSTLGIIKGRETEIENGRILFMSLLSDDIKLYCSYVTIEGTEKVGYINRVSKMFPCVAVRVGDKYRIYHGPNEGAIMIEAIIQFCRTHKGMLKIDQLALVDASVFPCGSEKGSGLLNLLVSNQLQGKYPFYMKFGFQPERRSALLKLQSNLRTMHSYLVTPEIKTTIEQITKTVVPDWLGLMFIGQMNRPLTLFLREVSRYDCTYYSKFYSELYNKLGLEILDDEEHEFILRL